ncbi:hypothetical protein [Vagococcus sp.]|uniref:hypothetical protein n=1 Tax=Vagococcus sp. TaxID=1933889 RepID=UPI003F998B78
MSDKTKGYLYRLPCIKNKYYVGITDKSLEERLTKHAKGTSKAQFVSRFPMEDTVRNEILDGKYNSIFAIEIELENEKDLPKYENQYELLLMALFGPMSLGGGFNRLNKGKTHKKKYNNKRNSEFKAFVNNNLVVTRRKYNIPNVFLSKDNKIIQSTSNPYGFKGIMSSIPSDSWTFGPEDIFPKFSTGPNKGKYVTVPLDHDVFNKRTQKNKKDIQTKYTKFLIPAE